MGRAGEGRGPSPEEPSEQQQQASGVEECQYTYRSPPPASPWHPLSPPSLLPSPSLFLLDTRVLPHSQPRGHWAMKALVVMVGRWR